MYNGIVHLLSAEVLFSFLVINSLTDKIFDKQNIYDVSENDLFFRLAQPSFAVYNSKNVCSIPAPFFITRQGKYECGHKHSEL
uniref:Secreted protein n=1 Tax=Schistosoma mansoni TaxID=6183 RepID=A0A5K4F9G2_SCHMA